VATRAAAHHRKQTTLAAMRDLRACFTRQCHSDTGRTRQRRGRPVGRQGFANTTFRRCPSPAAHECMVERGEFAPEVVGERLQ